jgi:hypothetical protein
MVWLLLEKCNLTRLKGDKDVLGKGDLVLDS